MELSATLAGEANQDPSVETGATFPVTSGEPEARRPRVLLAAVAAGLVAVLGLGGAAAVFLVDELPWPRAKADEAPLPAATNVTGSAEAAPVTEPELAAPAPVEANPEPALAEHEEAPSPVRRVQPERAATARSSPSSLPAAPPATTPPTTESTAVPTPESTPESTTESTTASTTVPTTKSTVIPEAPVAAPPATHALTFVSDPMGGHLDFQGRQVGFNQSLELPLGPQSFRWMWPDGTSTTCAVTVTDTVSRVKFHKGENRCTLS
jgi:hypothetical protein